MLRVVVAHEALHMRSSILRALEKAGAQVVGEAAHGAEAVALVSQHAPALLVLNATLAEVAPTCRRENPALLLLWCAQPQHLESLAPWLRDGKCDLVVTPFSPQAVAQKALALWRRHGPVR